MTIFSAETYQNEYLPEGASEVNAVVTVTASESASEGAATPTHSASRAAEIVIVDVSGSMVAPRSKLEAAKRATAAAIDCIRDGACFAIIAGSESATAIYPSTGGLAPASPATREAAKSEVARLKARDGTAIGTWLALADELFSTMPDAIHHAILLTDGRNEHETADALAQVLARCEGHFQCDCRGVGTDWEVRELRHIASTLLGSVDIVAEPSDLEADFRSMIEAAMGKSANHVVLRLWSPQGAEVAFLKQVMPTIEDLSDRVRRIDPLTVEYPTGAWGEESRDYHVCIRVPARAIGEEMLAGRITLAVDDQVVSQTLVRAVWSDDEELSARISREVAHYTGQAELAEAIQDGLEARKQGDEATATYKLGRAVRLAAAGGNDATMRLLNSVVDVQDAASGTVRLKGRVADADEMALDTRSTKTVRVQRADP